MWREEFSNELPFYGHRNWILVVDKAFPLQSSAGISYICSGEEIEDALEFVLESVNAASHVKPIIYTDKELTVLSQIGEEEAQMVEKLDSILKNYEVNSLLHDEIFKKMDEASKMFNVMIIKTESNIAYSSIFIELDCGYWNGEKEAKLRELL
ncbi:MAG: hypothetical protein R3Y50_10385 [Rikenellaceae bacterium]